MWLYYCLLSTVIWGFVAIAIKKCSNNEPKRIAILGMLIYHLSMILISLIIKPQIIANLSVIDMIKMLPGILIQSIGFYCSISAIKYGKVAITSSIQRAQVIVTFLLGILILRERLTILQLIISGVLVTLSIMLSRDKKNDEEKINKKSKQKAIMYSWGVVLFYGVSDFINKIYITEFQSPLYVMFNYAVIIIIGIFVYCLISKNWNYIDIRKINNKRYFILQALLDIASSIFNRFALLDGNVSIVSIISTSSIIVTILASRLILKERISWKKYIVVFGIFICVLLLSLITNRKAYIKEYINENHRNGNKQ